MKYRTKYYEAASTKYEVQYEIRSTKYEIRSTKYEIRNTKYETPQLHHCCRARLLSRCLSHERVARVVPRRAVEPPAGALEPCDKVHPGWQLLSAFRPPGCGRCWRRSRGQPIAWPRLPHHVRVVRLRQEVKQRDSRRARQQ